MKAKGIAIKDDAVEYPIGVVGNDIGLLSSQVEKLASFGNETITISGIKEIIEGSRDYSVFDPHKCVERKNIEKSFRIFRTLSETTEPYNLLGAINWQYSKMSIQATWRPRHGKTFQEHLSSERCRYTVQNLRRRLSDGTPAYQAAAALRTVFASFESLDIFLEAVFLCNTPFETAEFTVLIISLKNFFTFS